MSKIPFCMDTIGTRAYRELCKLAYANGIAPYKQAQSLGVSGTRIIDWKKGTHNPSAGVLRKMALEGYDVMYILLGERSKK